MAGVADEIRITLDDFAARGEKNRFAAGLSYSTIQFEMKGYGLIDIAIPNPAFVEPSAAFEKETGLSGISKHYRLPENISAPELEAYALVMNYRTDLPDGAFLEKMSEAWETLVRLNPELGGIKYNAQSASEQYWMIHGVASAFNVSDIQYFVSSMEKNEPPAATMFKSADFKKLSQAFNKAASRIQWAASPETLHEIERQLGEKKPLPRRLIQKQRYPSGSFAFSSSPA